MKKASKYLVIVVLILIESMLLFTGCGNTLTNNTIESGTENNNISQFEMTNENIKYTSISSESDFILEYGKENEYKYFDNLARNDGLSSRYAYKLPAGVYKFTIALDKTPFDTAIIYKFEDDSATSCQPITFTKSDFVHAITLTESQSISIDYGSYFYVKKIA